MANKKNADKTPHAKPTDAIDELSQLRSIVFGAAEKNIYDQITALTNKMEASISSLDKAFTERLSGVQQAIEQQLSDIDKRLIFIDKNHEDSTDRLEKNISSLASEHEILATTTQKDFAELTQSLDNESASLSTNFHEQLEQLKTHLDEVSNELSSSKTDRKTLAKLLATMATNLEADQL